MAYDQTLGQVPAPPRAVAPLPPIPPGYESPLAPAATPEVTGTVQPNDKVHPVGAPSRRYIVRTVNLDAGTATVVNDNGCGCGGAFSYPIADLVVDGHV